MAKRTTDTTLDNDHIPVMNDEPDDSDALVCVTSMTTVTAGASESMVVVELKSTVVVAATFARASATAVNPDLWQ